MSTTRSARLFPLLLLLLSLLLGGCEQGSGDTPRDEADETPPVPVETAIPGRKDIHAVYSGTATIEAFAEAEVVAKVAGEIRKIFVEEGEQVLSGQLMARLDGDRLRLEAKQAEANLRKLERDYERNLDLNKKGLVSSGAFENIKYEMEALNAYFELAKLQLSYTEIRAPIDGVIAERYIKTGNTISVNDPVFRVTNLQPLVAYMHVPEREYRKITAGHSAQIHVDALRSQVFPGVVSRISPVIDPATGTFKVSIEIADAAGRLKPGMFGRINIVHDTRVNALQILRSAIMEDEQKTVVFVIENSVARQRAVQTGLGQGDYIEITGGLGETDEYVITGQAGLKDGARVTIVNTRSISREPSS